MSNGVIEALQCVGARRIAVATAYNDTVNERLRAFLLEHGFEPVVITGMGLEAMKDVDSVTQQQLIDFAHGICRPGAVRASWGGFRTLEIIAPLIHADVPVR